MRDFFETVREQLGSSPGFRRALLAEIVQLMLIDDLQTAKDLLQEYVKGTIGFAALAAGLERTPAGLKRMLSLDSKAKADDLLKVIRYLQAADGVTITVKVTRAPASRVDAAA